MIYLLDTHILLWTLFNPGNLSEEILAILKSETDQKIISGINLWEISLKYSLGKLDLADLNPDQLLIQIKNSGFRITEISSEIMTSYYRLPKKDDHKDPFDRLLIWQSIESGYTLISHDKKIQQYKSDGLKLLLNH
ncbi:MAG: type II toxin-antitoxin system VapC family toxin [Spirochaeta sp.]